MINEHDINDWSKDFSAYKTKHYVRRVYACNLKYDLDTGRMYETTMEEL